MRISDWSSDVCSSDLKMPTADGRVQMYPCYSFETHIILAEIDPLTAHVQLREYVVGHDCGTMINPDIVHGMTYGGVAHGIGAALFEPFSYDRTGQLLPQSFMYSLIPSSTEFTAIHIVTPCPPSPLTEYR